MPLVTSGISILVDRMKAILTQWFNFSDRYFLHVYVYHEETPQRCVSGKTLLIIQPRYTFIALVADRLPSASTVFSSITAFDTLRGEVSCGMECVVLKFVLILIHTYDSSGRLVPPQTVLFKAKSVWNVSTVSGPRLNLKLKADGVPRFVLRLFAQCSCFMFFAFLSTSQAYQCDWGRRSL